MSNRILIVDDHELIRHQVRHLFRPEDDSVCEEAASGREAIAKARDFRPDLVVLDYAMPGMSGIEAAEWLRQMYPRLRIVMLTAFMDRRLMTEAYRTGITWVLSKTEDDVTKLRDFIPIPLRTDPSHSA